MTDLDDLDYRQRIVRLLETVRWARDKQIRRALQQEQTLLTDRRWWPTVLSLLALSPTPCPALPESEGMWFPPMPGLPARATITVSDVGLLAASVWEVLSHLPLHRLGPAGAANLFLALPDAETFADEASRLSSLIDDAFFETLLGLRAEAEWLGLEAFAQKVEKLRQLLLALHSQRAVRELAAQVVRARSDREVVSLIVQRARTAPAWLQSGLEELIPRARKGEVTLPYLPVAMALQKAMAARAEGQAEAMVIADLERWQPLLRFIGHYRLVQKAPFHSGEDWLARHGARAKAFLLQLGQVQGAQTAALFQLALAESRVEEEDAIASEPRLLPVEGEQEARLLAADAERQGQRTLAIRLLAAANRIATLLDDLARPERNPVARLAEQVYDGELSLDDALARLWQPLLPILRELGVARVVLVPDADLHALPLALGLAEEANAPAVAMAPSLRLYAQCLRRLREREPRENTLLLIANPTGDLLAAEVEAVLLRDLFAAHGQAIFTLTGDQATRQNIISTARVGNYWHFAGHACYKWWNPARSALRLAEGEWLPLFWVPIWLDLRATRLAVLSACETGVTPARDLSQEFEGLFTAFLTAGAPAVLASLWPVEELSTALLIHRFYQYHLGDPREGLASRPPAEALREAQRWLRTLPAEEALQHPLVDAVRRRNPKRGSSLWQQLLALESGVEYPYANSYFWAGFMLMSV